MRKFSVINMADPRRQQVTPPKSASPVAIDKVTLDVGGRKFVTLFSTLAESDFLHSLVSDSWEQNRQPDGSYFIDADPDLFVHILEYLRRGRLPLFWEAGKGHDLAKYRTLRREAAFLGIPRLEQWLASHKYLDTVRIGVKVASQIIRDGQECTFLATAAAMNQEVRTEWVEEALYPCTSVRHTYHSLSDECDARCMDRRWHRSAPSAEQHRVLKVAVVENVAVFDTDARKARLGGREAT